MIIVYICSCLKRFVVKKVTVVLGITFLLIYTTGLTSCEKAKVTPGDPVAILLTEKQKEVVDSANNFAFNLFRPIITGTKSAENIMISPFSISSALSMTLNGAGGETYDAMAKALSLDDKTLSEINDAYFKLMSDMVSVDDRVVINIANSVWVENSFTVKEGFMQALETYFDAEAKSFDINDAGAATDINSWIESKTNGKIKNMMSSLDPATVMLLINAVYFNGKWRDKFDKAGTSNRPFYLSSGASKDVPTMYNETDLAVLHRDNATIVDIPYGQGNYTMVVALPDEGVTPADIAGSLDAVKWQEWTTAIENAGTHIQLYLPKFKYEYKRSLVNDLTTMGMGIAFTDNADFSNISDESLKIFDVMHQTYIATDEEGTEAAAATVVVVGTTSANPSTTVININRPFLYFIREIYTGTIVFMGVVEDPSAS
jgi:serine protease inhibitor